MNIVNEFFADAVGIDSVDACETKIYVQPQSLNKIFFFLIHSAKMKNQVKISFITSLFGDWKFKLFTLKIKIS